VTGGFFLSDKIEHGYTFDGANYTVVDYPGARGTEIISVDESGAIIGNWLGSSDISHGFIERKGVFYSIDHPGSTSTQINAVNGKNTIVGTSSTPAEGSVAFIAKCIADQPECTP